MLPDTGSDGAVAVAERVRERIAAHEFLKASDGLDIRLTASVGVATLPDVAASAEELIKAADIAMYRVKDARQERRRSRGRSNRYRTADLKVGTTYDDSRVLCS